MKITNTHFKKSLSILLTLMIMLTALSTTAIIVQADDSGEQRQTDDGFIYVISDDDTVNIINYVGDAETVNIPRTIDDMEVTAISGAFKGVQLVKSIIVPDSVTQIESNSFDNCPDLEVVKINGNVNSIKAYTFNELPILKEIYYKSYIDTDSEVEIESEAFYKCLKLESITIPNGVRNIPSETIQVCRQLKILNIPQTCEEIASDFFSINAKTVPPRLLSNKTINKKITIETEPIPETEPNSDIIINPKGDVEPYKPSFTIFSYGNEYVEQFAEENEYPYVDLSTLFIPNNNISIKSGRIYTPVSPKAVPYKGMFDFKVTSNNNKLASVKNNEITALNKGTATITITNIPKAYPCYSSKHYVEFKVTTAPNLNKKTVTVKKGKSASIKVTGKAPAIKNVYYKTKYAKFNCSKSATSLKIKGLRKGTTTLKVKVNGVKTLKIKVKVKK